ncbi:hypothetical protein FKW77_003952 [Venturia effusa]|uniref:SnoaL-like domain-containing protein n=1 Tax=Venturia effusa TaxID=50376 RepID=A0A517LNQ5_9PEZI|nr:hypothetical protein FKW77_003952 [Venturia effusa]
MTDIWPSPPIIVPEQVKQLITRFFDISDSTDPDSGSSFAEELFTKDGYFKTHRTCIFRGHDEIASSRPSNLPIIAYRKHHFIKIYTNDCPATDLLVLGNFEIGFKTGSVLLLDFTARFVVDTEEGKLRSVEVFSDGGESKEAFEEAMRGWDERKGGK